MNPRSFNISLVFTSLALLLTVYLLQSLAVGLPVILFTVIPVYALLTYYLFYSMQRSIKKSPGRFVSSFMGAISIKLLVTVAFLAVYIYFFRDQKIPIALSVFVIYIAYTLVLIKELRKI